MPIDITELKKCYPDWAKAVFEEPIVKHELLYYNAYVCVGMDNPDQIWKTQEPVIWCNESLGKKGKVWSYLALNIWLFKNEEDAVLFKITWM